LFVGVNITAAATAAAAAGGDAVMTSHFLPVPAVYYILRRYIRYGKHTAPARSSRQPCGDSKWRWQRPAHGRTL